MRIPPIALLCALLSVGPAFAQDSSLAEIAALEAAAEHEAAFQLSRKWLEQQPDNREALEACGRLATRCGAFATAADCYEALLFLEPGPEFGVRLADALRELGRTDQATGTYQDALAMDRANVGAHLGIGLLLLDDPERRFEARLAIDFALAQAPDLPEALVARAEIDLVEWGTVQALERLRALIATNPETPRARLLAGKILAQWGQTAQAREEWTAYTHLEPCRPETWVLRHNLFPIGERALDIRGSYFLFSPDGAYIAYTGAGATARQQLLVCPASTPQEARAVLTAEGYLSGLSWSPDGSRLALRSYHQVETDGKKTWEYELWTVGADGADARRIHAGQYAGVPCWHPDGKRVCFDGYIPRKGRGLLVMDDAVGATQEAMAMPARSYSFQHVTWSPTGEGFVTLSVTYTPERLWRVSYHPAQNPNEPVILAEDPTTIYYPGFTQDGKTVVFLMRNARSTHDLYAVPVDGSLPRPACAIKGTYYASPASVHPDGKRILLYGVSGATQITVTGLN